MSVPAFSGQKPCQFQPNPFQSLPSTCHSRPTVLFTPSPAVTLTVLLQPCFRLQFAHSFALPPFSSPSQISVTSSVSATDDASFEASRGGGRMQLDAATSTVAVRSDA